MSFRSFAFYTVKSRLPIILTNIIDNLVRNKSQIIEKFGEVSSHFLLLSSISFRFSGC